MFTVPPSQASVSQNRFEFAAPDGSKTWSIPKLNYLPPKLVRRLQTLSVEDTVFALLDEFAPDLTDHLEDMTQVAAFYNEWAKESGVTVGESSGSSDSSSSTEEPSTETSSSSEEPSTISAPTD